MSLLRRTIMHINFKKEVTRQELIKKVLSRYESINSLDAYINYLYQAKYIEKIKPGNYKLIKKIPSFSTKRDILIMAYPHAYK